MSIDDYITWYVLYIPHGVYWWGLAVLAVSAVGLTAWLGVSRGLRWTALVLLVEYAALLLHFTVFMRPATGRHEWILTPLWSYGAIAGGTRVLIEENVTNVAVFLPVGFLLAVVMRDRRWWRPLMAGVALSLAVELLQLLLMRGFCETDDVIHNALGCIVGIIIFVNLHKLFSAVRLFS